MQRIAKESNLIKVKLICEDCKQSRHGCAGLWRGLGLEICCCCSCAGLEPHGESRENSNKDEVLAKKWNL
jgi:hypothetical protein